MKECNEETVFTFIERKKHHKIVLIATHRVVIVLIFKNVFVEGMSPSFNCTTLFGVQYLSITRSTETKNLKQTPLNWTEHRTDKKD
jgi:hypothetical protein